MISRQGFRIAFDLIGSPRQNAYWLSLFVILSVFWQREWVMVGSNKKTIIFCGGGSGGHVVPALTVIEKIQGETAWKVDYVGSYHGIERELVTSRSIPYQSVSTGKLRRYFSFQNFGDLFKIIWGFVQSFFYLLRYSKKNCLVFSFGGFVSVPVVLAAWLQGKKIYIHEQTTRMGLANKIGSLFADKIFLSFEDSLHYFPANKSIYTGYPVREECFSEEIKPVQVGGKVFDFKGKPLLFVTGGGNGSKLLNELVKNNLVWLKERFQILHQVGKVFEEEHQKLNDDAYISIPFVREGMIDLFKGAAIVVSRSGAGTVAELLACRKVSIFIPLKISQKNEQFHNAKEAQRKMGSLILEEDQLNNQLFLETIQELAKTSSKGHFSFKNGLEEIMIQLNRTPQLS